MPPPPRPRPSRPPLPLLLALALLSLGARLAPTGGRARRRPPPVASPSACNGAAALCARRYDEVAYPTAHNAMSNEDDGWLFANQRHGVGRALDDGVRALMLDVYDHGGRPYLCHGLCALGRRPLSEGLDEVARFLDAHPTEVVTLIFESHVPSLTLSGALVDAGLDRDALTHARGAPWPALGAMVSRGRRLVVFTESGGGSPPWLHDLWAHAQETPYTFRREEDFTCAPNRGAPGRGLFILNHFLSTPWPDRVGAERVNGLPVLSRRASECARRRRHLPNFVAVDHYDLGALLGVTASLNGLAAR